jgi:hypothetical protein
MSQEQIERDSMAISAITIERPKMVTIALSCRSITEASIRDGAAQISEGRFEPNVFDANI